MSSIADNGWNFNSGANTNNWNNGNYVLPVSDLYKEKKNMAKYQKHIPIERYYEAYRRFRKHCRDSEQQQVFEKSYACNIAVIHRDVCQRAIDLGTSFCFIVTEPKPREIFAGSVYKRLLDTLAIDILLPYMQPHFCDRHFNVRKDFGLSQYQRQLCQDMAENKDGWIVSSDISSFFMSMRKDTLKNLWHEVVIKWYGGEYADELFYIVDTIIDYEPEKHCEKRSADSMWQLIPLEKSLFTNGDGRGLPIGDLLSQYSSILITEHFCKMMTERYHSFGMFADDWYVTGTHEGVLSALPYARTLLADVGLSLNEKKTRIQPARHGAKLCGVFAYPNRCYVSNRVVSKARQFIYYLHDHPHTDVKKAISTLNSYFGLMRHFETYNIRYDLVHLLPDWLWNYIYIQGHYEIIKLKDNDSKSNFQQE